MNSIKDIPLQIDIAALLGLIFGALVVVTKWAIDVYKWFLSWRKQDKGRALLRDNIDHEDITAIIWSIMTDFDCIRVFLLEFHNGDVFYSGQHRQRMSAQKEAYRTGIDKISPYYDNVEVTTYIHKIIKYLRVNGKESFYLPSAEDPLLQEIENKMNLQEIRHTMAFFKIKSFNYVALRDKNGNLVALLCLHYNLDNPLNGFDIQSVEQRKKKIEHIYNR